MFGQDGKLALDYEILKENHETLLRDYKSCQEMIKLEEDTYEIIKTQFQSRKKELEVTNMRLFEECEKERIEKEKYKKMLEEANVALTSKKEKAMLAKRKEEEEFEKMENKYVELAEKFGVLETEYAYLKSIYDSEVAASGTLSAVMSEIGDTENEVNHNVDTDVTEDMVISDESDAEQNQEEECKIEAKSVDGNQSTREVFTPRSVNHPPPFSASPSSSSSSPSSSSSSDRYEDVFKPPADWPDWAIPEGSKKP